MVAKPDNYVATKSLPDWVFLSAFRRPNAPWPESLDGWPPKVLNAKAKKLLKRGLISRVEFGLTIEGQQLKSFGLGVNPDGSLTGKRPLFVVTIEGQRVLDEAQLGEFPRNTLPEEA